MRSPAAAAEQATGSSSRTGWKGTVVVILWLLCQPCCMVWPRMACIDVPSKCNGLCLAPHLAKLAHEGLVYYRKLEVSLNCLKHCTAC